MGEANVGPYNGTTPHRPTTPHPAITAPSVGKIRSVKIDISSHATRASANIGAVK